VAETNGSYSQALGQRELKENKVQTITSPVIQVVENSWVGGYGEPFFVMVGKKVQGQKRTNRLYAPLPHLAFAVRRSVSNFLIDAGWVEGCGEKRWYTNPLRRRTSNKTRRRATMFYYSYLDEVVEGLI